MSRNEVERIQDSVHGLMEFRGLETIVVKVLRTPEIQRLRKIRQLGAVHYVFPGAEHSRFSHSLGAAHLAIRFGRHLQNEARRLFVGPLVPDEHAIADLGLAALCHDLGHGPLSHAWEREIVGEHWDRKKWAKSLGLNPDSDIAKTGKWHELVGQALLAREDGQLYRLLELQEKGTAKRVRDLLAGSYYFPYLPRLLSSDVDVDRADFIMRDTHHSGVAYGRFDLNWLLSTCTLGRYADNNQWVVGFDGKKSVRVIEQFLIARQAMYETVYYHKAVRCIEGMIALLLRRLKEFVTASDLSDVAEIVQPAVRIMRGEALDPVELLKLDDFVIFVLIDMVARGAFKDDTAHDLAQRLQSRDLFKLVPVNSDDVTNFLDKSGSQEKMYEAVKKHVPGLPQFYIHVDRPKFEMFSQNTAQQVMLVNANRKATRAADHENLRHYSTLRRSEARIFTVSQAVEDVRKLISGDA
jgi:HD superfamily phosphohydrolase